MEYTGLSFLSSFNSRPHKEVDRSSCASKTGQRPFNSRPHKEVDNGKPGTYSGRNPFNSRPHKEVDQLIIVSQILQQPFNSRPHKEVDLRLTKFSNECSIFQFTTSQGGRPCYNSYCLLVTFFQFTTSQGGRPGEILSAFSKYSFNSRPHKEVDQQRPQQLAGFLPFNSRPHKEVDGATI